MHSSCFEYKWNCKTFWVIKIVPLNAAKNTQPYQNQIRIILVLQVVGALARNFSWLAFIWKLETPCEKINTSPVKTGNICFQDKALRNNLAALLNTSEIQRFPNLFIRTCARGAPKYIPAEVSFNEMIRRDAPENSAIAARHICSGKCVVNFSL